MRCKHLRQAPNEIRGLIAVVKGGGGALMKGRRLKLRDFGAETLTEVARQNGGTNETAPLGAVEVGGGILRGVDEGELSERHQTASKPKSLLKSTLSN